MVVHCSKKLKYIYIYIYIKLISLLSLKKKFSFSFSLPLSLSLSLTSLLSFSFASHLFFFLSSTTLISSLLRQPTRRPISPNHRPISLNLSRQPTNPSHRDPISPSLIADLLPMPHHRWVCAGFVFVYWVCVCARFPPSLCWVYVCVLIWGCWVLSFTLVVEVVPEDSDEDNEE